MPNIISKILHRKSRSGSSSGSTSDLTSPSSHGLVVSRDWAGASTIRLDDRFDGEPGSGPTSPESRRKSMSVARGSPVSPSAPARKSLDARPNGIYVNPARPAPPPPVPGAESHGLGSTQRNGADASTVVIDGRADPRLGPSHALGPDTRETTAGSGDVFSTPPRPVQRNDDADAAGRFDRRGLFDDTPAASTALDHFSTSPSGAHALDSTREAYAPPGPVDQFNDHSRELDLDRDLPPLPRNPSHEIKQVDSRRRPTMSETGPRQSVEGEMGREPMDAADRERGSRPMGGVRGMEMERSIHEEDPHASALPAGKERTSSEIPTRGSSLRHAGANGIDADESVEGRMAGLSVNDSAKERTSMNGTSGGLDALQRQRMELVGSIVDGAEQRRLQRGELSPEGVKTFEKAGMGHLVGKASTVDVTTQWLKPVVHETIIPRIHTEYTTIITREIHRHHVYPKIQPIEDPNPIVLPPLHRIFSPQTGKWHEVQGDDAAIAILGEDVFRNGPKEVRHVRTAVDDDVLRRESNEDVSIPPVGADGKGVSTVAPATQAGRARVVEREGILGGEMGEWKKTDRGHLFGKLREEIGRAM